MLAQEIYETKNKVNAWFQNNYSDSMIFGIKKPSSFFDCNSYESMLLPATYNATHCLVLTGAYTNLSEDKKQGLINFFLSFRGNDGYFYMPGIEDHHIVKDTNPFDKKYVREYVNFHISNYTLGALSSLGYDVSQNLDFLKQYDSIEKLESWLMQRNWNDPWAEGNFIVNLGSFYLMAMSSGDMKYMPMLTYLLDWHDKNQDPKTGYWGTDKKGDRDTLEHAMAGAAHNFHLYYAMNRKLNYVDIIVDHCIEYLNGGIRSACLDIDVVDILTHIYVYDYRTYDIENALRKYIYKLLQYQNVDGGFCDVKTGVRRFDSWVCGYWEPQGLSNCFATWFRTVTLGMIDNILFPEYAHKWTFRNTIGIGYYNSKYKPKI